MTKGRGGARKSPQTHHAPRRRHLHITHRCGLREPTGAFAAISLPAQSLSWGHVNCTDRRRRAGSTASGKSFTKRSRAVLDLRSRNPRATSTPNTQRSTSAAPRRRSAAPSRRARSRRLNAVTVAMSAGASRVSSSTATSGVKLLEPDRRRSRARPSPSRGARKGHARATRIRASRYLNLACRLLVG